MKNKILNQLDDPQSLERLYRSNKLLFKREFNAVFEKIKDEPIAQFWSERLNFESAELSWGTRNQILLVILAAFVAGILAKLPSILSIDEQQFYPRNIAFIVFPILTAYFIWKNKLNKNNVLLILGLNLFSVVYINMLPNTPPIDRHSFVLACLHLPLFLWVILGFAFTGNDFAHLANRLNFLKFNGELLVITGLVLISGVILTGITMGLFSLIKIRIEEFYFQYIVVLGLAAAPIIGTYILEFNPQVVNRVTPIIAKIFTPLVLITLVFYLFAIIWTGKSPYTDRDFLLIFNLMLIGVMAIIVFSVTEQSGLRSSKVGVIVLFILSIITIVLNGIALSAIIFRISEWGFTPNRLAVLGSNVLILTNLLLVSYALFQSIRDLNRINLVGESIAKFLPVYALWAAFVTFVFPLIFQFK